MRRPWHPLLLAATFSWLASIGASDTTFPGGQRSKVANNEVFLRGRYVEIGMHSVASYGTSGEPGEGFNGDAGANNKWDGGVGFIVDYDKNGFSSGSPAYSGDYFLPGSPVEGWAVSYRDGSPTASKETFLNKGQAGYSDIAPTTVNDASTEGRLSAAWVGATSKLKISKSTTFGMDDLYFVTTVTLKNMGTRPLHEVRYLRNVDPDQEQPWSGEFSTHNHVKFQPESEGYAGRVNADDPNMCLVVAKGENHPELTLGLGTVHPGCRVTHFGFDVTDTEAAYTDTSWREYTASRPHSADEAVNMVIDFGSLDAGASVTFDWAYILNEADLLPALESINAISILQPTDTASGSESLFSVETRLDVTSVKFWIVANGNEYDEGEDLEADVVTAETKVFSVTFDSTTFANGDGYTFKAVATLDTGGTREATKVVRIDNSGPQVRLDADPPAPEGEDLYPFSKTTITTMTAVHTGGPAPASVAFFMDLNSGSTLLKTDTSSPFTVEVSTAHLAAFTPVIIKAVAKSADGFETVATFSGFVPEPSVAPSDIMLSTTTVSEAVGVDTVVATMTTTDANAGDTHTYTVVVGDSFKVVGSSLVVAKPLDFETEPSVALTLRTTEDTPDALSYAKSFTITVTDVNEPPDSVMLSSTAVAEDAAVHTTVGSLSATDPDTGPTTFVYTLASPGGLFYLSGTDVKVARRLDYEAVPSASVTVEVTDSGTPPRSLTKAITIAITDVNEPPTAVLLSATSVAENLPGGTAVGTLSATDPDVGQSHTFALPNNGDGAFALDGLSLNTAKALNFEQRQAYTIEVVATDDGSPAASLRHPFTITVDDVAEAPAVSDVTFSVNENAAKGLALGIVPTDASAVAEGGLSFVLADPTVDNANHFAVQECSGVVYVDTSELDFETQATYTLQVDVTGELTSRSVVTVNLLDVNEPPAPSPSPMSADVQENAAVGTVVIPSINPRDPDAGSVATFTSVGSGVSASLFVVAPATGAVTVAGPINYEALLDGERFYDLLIEASDGSLSASVPVRINVQDVNEAPRVSTASLSVAELAPPGTVVSVPVQAFDEDGDDVAFAIEAGNVDNVFEFGAASGTPSLDRAPLVVATGAVLDYETLSQYALRVRASDGRGGQSVADVVVSLTDVNEAPTVPATLTLSVAENRPASHVVGSLAGSADDVDAGAVLSWSVASWGDEAQATFAVDGQGNVVLLLPPDHEATPTLTFVAEVSDQGGLSAQTTVTVHVTDVNEAPRLPDLTTSWSVDENQPAHTLLMIGSQPRDVCASDQDAGQLLHYTLSTPTAGLAVSDASVAGSDTVCGELRTTESLDFESTPELHATITVCDDAEPQLCSSSVLHVVVNDVNEPPQVVEDHTFGLRRLSPVGTPVGTAQASDPEGREDSLQFSIDSQAVAGMFSIHPVSGLLTVAGSSDALELPSTFFVAVTATETGQTPNLSNTEQVSVVITDANWPPHLTPNTRYVVPENAGIGHVIGTIGFEDRDNRTQSFAFELAPASRPVALSFDTSTLRLSIVVDGALDHETEGEFTVTVTVTDSHDTAPSSDTAVVVVEVSDVNEPPAIDASRLFLQVAENSTGLVSAGSVVGDVLAIDPDDPATPFGTLQFSIQAVDGAMSPLPFNISPVPGVDREAEVWITTVGTPLAPDFETTPSYDCVVSVTDGTGLTASVVTTIAVLDRNDPPTLAPHAFIVAEDAAIGSMIGVVAGDDVDKPVDLTYTIVSSDAGDAVAVNTFDGTVSVAAPLDFEAQRVFTLVVRATDKGHAGDATQLSAEGTVVVTVTNVNDVSITGVTGAVPHRTAGGQQVTLHGTNFGHKPAAGQGAATVSVTYGATGLEFTATDCAVDAGGNTAITCTTARGAGQDLQWRVAVHADGIAGDAALSDPLTGLTSYQPPSITAVSESARALNTEGGDTVVLYGTDFGLFSADLQVVYRAGADGTVFAASDCVLEPSGVDEGQQVTCVTSPGVGTNLLWLVTVRGQDSELFAQPLASGRRLQAGTTSSSSYKPPEVDAVAVVNGAAQALRTSGGELVVLTGNQFGPAEFHGVSVTYGPPGQPTRHTATSCQITESHTEVRCRTTTGVGAGHVWQVSVGGQQSSPSADTTAYAPPALVQVTGPGAVEASTQGGQRVTITGSQFGTAADASDLLLVTYGPSGVEYTAPECVVSVAFTAVQCVTAAGTGAGHSWQVTVDGQASALLRANTSYHRPIISFYEDVGTVNGADTCGSAAEGTGTYCGLTAGGQPLALHGLNFGMASQGNTLAVTYGHNGEFIATDCRIETDHVLIVCTTAPGAGVGHVWEVVIDGQVSETPSTSYGAPEVHGVTGPGAADASTYGGERVTITGINFAQQQFLESVTYGPSGWEYTAVDCTIVSETQIDCLTAPGVGRDLLWQVVVASQVSTTVGTVTTSYADPVLVSSNFDATSRSTAGGYTVTLEATGVGATVGPAVEVLVELLGEAEDPIVVVPSAVTPGGTTPDSTADAVSQFNDVVQFVMPEGRGRGRAMRLVVQRVDRQAGIASNAVAFDYADPVVVRVQTKEVFASDVGANVTDGTTTSQLLMQVTLQGANFGRSFVPTFASGVTVYTVLDPVSRPVYDFTPAVFTAWSHTTITFIVPSKGSAQVNITSTGTDGTAFEQASSVVEFDFDFPAISSRTGPDGEPLPPPLVHTNGTSWVRIVGRHLWTEGVDLNVTIGGYYGGFSIHPSRITRGTIEGVTSPVDANQYIEVQVPEWQGVNVPLLVFKVSGPQPHSSNPFLIDTFPPLVTEAVSSAGRQAVPGAVLTAHTDGTTRVRLSGSDFGAAGVEMRFAVGVGMFTDCVGDHDWLECTVPAGDGTLDPTGQPLAVVVAQPQMACVVPTTVTEELLDWDACDVGFGSFGSAQLSQPITFRYEAPVVVRPPEALPTTGGDLVLYGRNFGTPSSAVSVVLTPLGDTSPVRDVLECASPTLGSSDGGETLTCALLAGAGEYTVEVVVGGQALSPSNVTFAFQPPSVTSLSVTSGATAGGYEVVLAGTNFGGADMFAAHGQVTVGDTVVLGSDVGAVTATHTTVAVAMPEGQGAVYVGAVVAGLASQPTPFTYAPPQVDVMSPPLVPTAGSQDPAVLQGSSFGTHGAVVEVTWPPVEVTYFPDATGPQALGDPVTHIRRLPDVNCTATTETCRVVSQAHDRVEVLLPPGVGRNVNLQLHLVTPASSTPGASPAGTYTASSDPVTFHHEAPAVTNLTPNELDARGDVLTLFGVNFGDIGVHGTSTDPSRPFPYVHIGDLPCTDAALLLSSAGDAQTPFIACTTPKQLVGRKNLTLSVAYQTLSMETPLATKCLPGYYGQVGEYCEPCPEGASCAGGLHEPVALPGWYIVNATQSDVCPEWSTREACPWPLPCQPASACAGANLCNAGYVDAEPELRCGACADGYFRLSGECEPCPDNAWLLIVAFFVAATGLAIAGYVLNKKQTHLGFLSIAVDYFQVLSMFVRSKVDWPSSLRRLFNIFSAFNFDFNITAPACTFDVDYVQKWAVIEALPLGALLLFALLYVVQLLKKRVVLGRRNRLHSHLPTLVGTVLVMMYFLYLSLTRTILDVFNCQPTNPDTDGKLYLEVVFEECGKPGGTQLTLLPFAIVALFVYTVGYPVLVAWILHKNRLAIQEDQLLRAMNMGRNRVENPDAYQIRKMLHKLYYSFRPSQYYWVLVILARKAGIAFVALMFARNPAFQMAMALLILFICYAAQVRHMPYMSPSEHELVLADHRQRAAMGDEKHRLLAHKLSAVLQHGRKRTHHAAGWLDSQRLRGTQAQAVVNFAVNYNTSEATLLFCAVLVNLGGVMFESDRFANGVHSDQKEAITWIILAVIAFSMLYIAFILLVELGLVCKGRGPQKKTKGGGKALRRVSANPGTAQFNPLFHLTTSKHDGTEHLKTMAALMSQSAPPTQQQWEVIQGGYEQQTKRVNELLKDNKEMKRKLQSARGQGRSQRALPTGRRHVHKAFVPVLPRPGSVVKKEAAAAAASAGAGTGAGAESKSARSPLVADHPATVDDSQLV